LHHDKYLLKHPLRAAAIILKDYGLNSGAKSGYESLILLATRPLSSRPQSART
jgi:hypothetical protein